MFLKLALKNLEDKLANASSINAANHFHGIDSKS